MGLLVEDPKVDGKDEQDKGEKAAPRPEFGIDGNTPG
jgi:hypothetical protein